MCLGCPATGGGVSGDRWGRRPGMPSATPPAAATCWSGRRRWRRQWRRARPTQWRGQARWGESDRCNGSIWGHDNAGRSPNATRETGSPKNGDESGQSWTTAKSNTVATFLMESTLTFSVGGQTPTSRSWYAMACEVAASNHVRVRVLRSPCGKAGGTRWKRDPVERVRRSGSPPATTRMSRRPEPSPRALRRRLHTTHRREFRLACPGVIRSGPARGSGGPPGGRDFA